MVILNYRTLSINYTRNSNVRIIKNAHKNLKRYHSRNVYQMMRDCSLHCFTVSDY